MDFVMVGEGTKSYDNTEKIAKKHWICISLQWMNIKSAFRMGKN